jgi:hypothetical protein
MKKFKLPVLALGAALAFLTPVSAFARHHHEWREHRHGVGIYVGPAPAYGFYDQWGYWHPYRGHWGARGYYYPY